MTKTICILGRQPALGLAELESLYGADAIKPIGKNAVLLDIQPSEIAFAFLGGTVKFCKLLTELDSTNWADIQKFLVDSVPDHAKMLPEGKMRLGLSVYDLDATPKQILATGLELKKILRKDGRAVRIVPNNQPALNSAQVLHNQLTSELGWELVFVRNGNETIVAQTIAEQDIEAYSERDYGRPKRDSRVGMLPPKLAQIILNLATGVALDANCGPDKKLDKTILDPFCGTGVVLQEASLMGYDYVGSDLEPRMIDYSSVNLKWLQSRNTPVGRQRTLEIADATSYRWADKFDFVASEAYLGQPFSSLPSQQKLDQVVQDVNTIIRKFLQNLTRQSGPGLRLCLALPAWKIQRGFKHLPLLDHLTDMGYTRMSFVHAAERDLIYHREGQIVGRELVVLIRK